jgi:uncharacterized protein (DUF58 family)
MRSVAGVALTTSAIFLLIVGVMLNSGALFYMSTAVIATLGASRLQAWLSVRGLRFERVAPDKAQVGEDVSVEITVWSDRRIRRPLVTVVDQLPPRLAYKDRTQSLPIAPAFDLPIRSQYRFKPMRRGRYQWDKLVVAGTDALGLVTMAKSYAAESTDLLVTPRPLPLDIELPPASGWGAAESEHGQARGAGIEPRGIRDYVPGDSLRYIHWKSTARTGQLLVKEFETGSHAAVGFVLQRTAGTDLGTGGDTSFERMCSHTAYLADRLLKQGVQVLLPTIESGLRTNRSPYEREQEILKALAEVEPDTDEGIATEALRSRSVMPPGSLIYVLAVVKDPELPGAVRQLTGAGYKVCALLYDPTHFEPAKKPSKKTARVAPATEEGFVEALLASGADIRLVPPQEVL